MLKDERQQHILEILRREGRVLATELSQQLDVSEDTIRRDLRELADAGQLLRVHGGGLPHSPAAATFHERSRQAPEAKESIARATLSLIHDGQTIIFDGGTTTLMVAQQLPPTLNAVIFTNSPIIAAALIEHPRVDVILIGGRLYKTSVVTTGSSALEALRSIHADLCLLGVCSLDPSLGVTTPDYEEASVKRAMVAAADQVAALVSPEKLDTASTQIVLPITALTYLVTAREIPDDALDVYRMAGVTVIKES